MDVVVTLESRNFSRDFSLPCNVQLKELYPRLLKALQYASSTRFADWRDVALASDEGVLADPEATLLDYGVCTGKKLYLVEEGQGRWHLTKKKC